MAKTQEEVIEIMRRLVELDRERRDLYRESRARLITDWPAGQEEK